MLRPAPLSSAAPARSERGAVSRLLVVAVVAVGLGIWLVIALVTLWSARGATRDGVDRLEAARDALSPERIVEGEGLDDLRAARDDFARAHDRIRAPWVAPLRLLPVAGRHVRSVDALSSAAVEVVDVGVDAMEVARAELASTPNDGPSRVRLIAALGDVARDSVERLEAVDLGPGDALIAPLRDARTRFEEELTDLRDAATRLRDASEAFARFLGGPSRYLVFAANNNEMRVGSGTFLSVGELELVGGGFDLAEMTPTGELQLAESVDLPDDFAARWGWLAPGREWRNLASSPRFDTQAELAARMWEASGGPPVDGVIALDPVALRALLRAAGPVTVEGVEYRGDNVLDELYRRQYEDFDVAFDQAARRDRLAEVARAAIRRLDEGGWEAADLVAALRDAAQGRHVLAWARDPQVQRGWEAAHIAGALQPDSLLVGLHNRGGNKLDQFLQVSAALDTGGRVGSGGERPVRITFTIRSDAPPGLPSYVAGPGPAASGGAPGLYQGLLVVQLPPGSGDVMVSDAAGSGLGLVTFGPDGPHTVAAAYVEVPRGETVRYTVTFRVPATFDALRIEPSARVPEIVWTHGGAQWSDERARTVPTSP